MPLLTEQRKKQRGLLIVLGLVVVVTSGVVLFGVFMGRQGTAAPKSAEISERLLKINAILSGVREIDLDVSLLNNRTLQDLSAYKDLPEDIQTGRANPFIPY